jgi:hypothetical protein
MGRDTISSVEMRTADHLPEIARQPRFASKKKNLDGPVGYGYGAEDSGGAASCEAAPVGEDTGLRRRFR